MKFLCLFRFPGINNQKLIYPERGNSYPAPACRQAGPVIQLSSYPVSSIQLSSIHLSSIQYLLSCIPYLVPVYRQAGPASNNQ